MSDGWTAKPGDVLYHGFQLDSPFSAVLLNNAVVARGYIEANCMYRRQHPRNAGAVAPYEVLNRHRDKEAVFERVRVEHYAHCPTRLGCLFLFDTRAAADAGNAKLFGGQLTILEAELVDVFAIGRFDMRQLEASKPNWVDAAHRYWSGEASPRSGEHGPLWEVVLDGSIQLRGWEPYGKRLT